MSTIKRELTEASSPELTAEIDRASVHRIHSGQVVLDLPGAVKELVENALDAGATSVDVRLKDNGLETVEVVDNGSGIEEADWPSVALKHHTSKLPSLDQLAQVSTFGFRGEALSALCALCESVTVVTATKETAPMGAILTLGRDGRVLDDKGRVARQRGTTITLTGLFKPFAVRRKEFERTAKRELTRTLGLMTAYALVPAAAADGKGAVKIRVEVVGSGRSGKRSTVLSTDGRGALRSSVAAVWGPKALEGVVDLDLAVDVEVDKAMARREGIDVTSQSVRVVGLISSGAWGQGRASTDRQFTYINGRPCNLPKVVKAVNEVYKSFNTNQSPFAVLDFQIPKESVDINVSPDKRTIFLHSEANLIEALRNCLDEFFQPTRSSYTIGGASSTLKDLRSGNQATQAAPVAEEDANGDGGADEDADADVTSIPDLDSPPSAPRMRRQQSLHDLSEGEEELSQSTRSHGTGSSSRNRSSRRSPQPRVVQQTLDTTVAFWSPKKRSNSASGTASPANADIVTIRAPATGRKAQTHLRQRIARYASQGDTAVDNELEDGEDEDDQPLDNDDMDGDDLQDDQRELNAGSEDEREENAEPEATGVTEAVAEADTNIELEGESPAVVQPADVVAELSKRPRSTSVGSDDVRELSDTDAESPAQPRSGPGSPIDVESASPNGLTVTLDDPPTLELEPRVGYREEIISSHAAGEATLRFDLSRLQRRSASRRAARDARTGAASARNAFTAVQNGAATSAAGVGNRDMAAAEAALSRVISKADFAAMEVVGQFNKGFIIARLRHDQDRASGSGAITDSDDLFIVDQHASDEKYNFETLQRTTVIKAQALIRPRPLHLTAADELVAMDNLDLLRANGFEVGVDEDAVPGRGERLTLRAMPVSRETTFDVADLEQLLHLLGDSARAQGQMVRCAKARAMFAMRACRKSIMIGKSLTRAQMVALLRNMGTIDQPWNCPHGRPTMRHLCAMPAHTQGRGRIDWATWA